MFVSRFVFLCSDLCFGDKLPMCDKVALSHQFFNLFHSFLNNASIPFPEQVEKQLIVTKTCTSIASKSALALSVLRQQNFRILRRFFRTSLTPAICRYTCHALMSADFLRISQYFVRKLYSISLKIRKNPYTWRLCTRSNYGLVSVLYLILNVCTVPPISLRCQYTLI